MSTSVSVVGTVATAPKTVTLPSGAELCTFRLADGERRYDAEKKEWIDGHTNWFTVNAFRALATHAGESLSKGDRVIVSGRLRVKQWEKDERSGTSVEIDADALGPELRWGTSVFTKRTHAKQGGAAATASQANAVQGDDSGAELAVGEEAGFAPESDAGGAATDESSSGPGWFVPETSDDPFDETS
ncbi:single-stranded DNA-binding protein [Leucobacter chinensis]|uniref:single-stranded DNA-binding protein n=1 Tax=Leucobacter chinensis TaxID=2851010 RepID=UPI001C24E87D|nr:single-stranded DNA-binding protein [Leucobacter chinensis]